jgi:hypothetical protein
MQYTGTVPYHQLWHTILHSLSTPAAKRFQRIPQCAKIRLKSNIKPFLSPPSYLAALLISSFGNTEFPVKGGKRANHLDIGVGGGEGRRSTAILHPLDDWRWGIEPIYQSKGGTA